MAKIFKYILDFQAQTSKFSKDVGGMQGVLKGAAAAAGALFAADKIMDAAAAVADYAQEISALQINVQTLTGLQGAALDSATGQVKALADSYEQDLDGTLRATNALMREFGVTNKEAFDVMNAGFAEAANFGGDFLQQLSEYSTHFREAGLSAEQMVAVISQGQKMGVFSDKSADAIKEGSIRLREMTKSTQDALNAIGLSSTQIQNDISSGNRSMFEVMQLVSKQLQSLPQQSPAVGAALADIFGGPGEDAVNFIRSLADMDLTMQGVIDNATQAQIDWTNELAEFNNVGSQVFGGTTTLLTQTKSVLLGLVNDGIKGLVSIANYFIDLYNESMLFRGAIEMIALNFKMIGTTASAALEVIWNNLKTTGKLLKAVFTFDLDGIKEAWAEGFKGAADIAVEWGTKTADNFATAWGNTLTPKEKISLISITEGEATVAGAIAGQAFGKGIAQGLAAAKPIDSKKMGDIAADVDTDAYYQKFQDFQDVNKMMADEFSAIGENTKVPESINQLGDSLTKQKEQVEAFQGAAQQGFASIGNSIVAGLGLAEDGFEGFLGGLLNTTVQLLSMMMAQSIANSIAGATASGASTGPAAVFTTPAFIATAVGGVLSAFAAIPSFWSGGTVPGTSFSGDKVLARVNSGEEILRRTDPRHSDNLGTASAAEPQVVVQTMIPRTVIRKGDIYISYEEGKKEYQKRNGRG